VAPEISDNDGYPWLSWARTGVFALAGVLVVGLVISVCNPRSPSPAAEDGPVAAAKSPGPAQAATESRPDSPAPAAPKTSSDVGVPASEAMGSAVAKETPASEPVPRASATRPTPAVPHVAQAPPQAPALATPISSALPKDTATAPQAAAALPQADGPAAKSTASAADISAPGADAAKATPPVQDPEKQAAFVRAAADVRRSMGQRNLTDSKQSLQTAAANAQGAADQAELERLQALQDHLEQFWEGIRKSIAALQATEEIELSASDRVAVIEASRDGLTVRREGRTQGYRIETLPFDLLAAIVRTSFQPTPGSELIVGAFLAMDAHGNRTAARKYWQDASRGGASQAALLLPELDLEVPKTGRGKP
jgi:hypothetical protein